MKKTHLCRDRLTDAMYLVMLYYLKKNKKKFFLYETVTSLGWTLNSGSNLALTSILFLFF